jgi:asparagine synthase (glutamine-hydrolysing)
MCGITGFIMAQNSHTDPQLRTITQTMLSRLSHRGPDSSGIWTNEAEGVALGHTRLSILDLSPAGHQPMISKDGRLIITFNGEIYNYLEIALELESTGASFEGHSDTEVLLQAIASWGIRRTLEKANGMFAFAVWDNHKKELTLARDRFGKKPLYYGWQGSTFFFSSELRALKTHPCFKATINRDALACYFRYSYIPSPYCIYKDIRKLEQGSYVTINPKKRQMPTSEFWSLKEVAEKHSNQLTGITEAEAIQLTNQKIRESVQLRLISDVPVGAFLSGGIDSSLVVSHMQALSSRPAKTFTIGFNEKKYDEAPAAKAIAQHLGTEHTECYIGTNELQDYIPTLSTVYDEPFSDISQLPSYLVCKLAREQVTVALSGDGGDEFFCGYDRYTLALKKWSKLQSMPKHLRKSIAMIMTIASRMAKNSDQISRNARLFYADSAVDVFNLRNERLENATNLVIGSKRIETQHQAKAALAALPTEIEQMMQLDISTWLSDDILVKMDRASMANSLEVRNPLLDYNFATHALSLPLHIKSQNGTSKWLLKQCLKEYIPNNLTDGPKRGFSVPISQWLRGPLRDWAEDLLSESRLKHDGYINPNAAKWLWLNFLKGNNRYRSAIWSLIMFQAWLNDL